MLICSWNINRLTYFEPFIKFLLQRTFQDPAEEFHVTVKTIILFDDVYFFYFQLIDKLKSWFYHTVINWFQQKARSNMDRLQVREKTNQEMENTIFSLYIKRFTFFLVSKLPKKKKRKKNNQPVVHIQLLSHSIISIRPFWKWPKHSEDISIHSIPSSGFLEI